MITTAASVIEMRTASLILVKGYFCIRNPGAAAPPRAQLRISMGLGLTGVYPADCSSHLLLNFLPAR